MKKAMALALILAVCLVLTSCGSTDGSNGEKREVNVCSWGEYIDENLIYQFEEETGIQVNYSTAESNEALYSLLSMGGADYDVIVPSDYMISQLIEEGLLAELNYENIPNFSQIDDRFKNLPYDPENKYTVPYTWGTLGLIYNSTMVDGPITSWSAMFDPAYANNVLMIRNSRDALGIALIYLGYSVNTTNEAEIREAFCTYYAGDFLTLLDNNPDLVYVVPKEGSNWFVDAMCVLKDAQHKEEAEAWINFLASNEASMANMDYIGYASPNTEVLAGYPAYYEETYGEPLDQGRYEIMAAPEDVLDTCEAYLVLPAETRALYNDLWTELGI